jgi:hypothetical protein
LPEGDGRGGETATVTSIQGSPDRFLATRGTGRRGALVGALGTARGRTERRRHGGPDGGGHGVSPWFLGVEEGKEREQVERMRTRDCGVV